MRENRVGDDWNRHWRDYSAAAEKNPAQSYRRELVFSLLGLGDAGKDARILDIGSGQGDMAAAILSRFPQAQVLGLELSRSGVEISKKKVPGARFVQRDLLDDSQPAPELRGWATHAVCSEVIEHVDHPSRLLENARSYLAQGGLLVLTAPGGPMSAFDKHIGHRKHWIDSEIASVLAHAGFQPERISGAGFPFFNLYRCVVILRGAKLIEDVRTQPDGAGSFGARTAMAVFHQLIRKNLNSTRRGWQMIATARSS